MNKEQFNSTLLSRHCQFFSNVLSLNISRKSCPEYGANPQTYLPTCPYSWFASRARAFFIYGARLPLPNRATEVTLGKCHLATVRTRKFSGDYRNDTRWATRYSFIKSTIITSPFPLEMLHSI